MLKKTILMAIGLLISLTGISQSVYIPEAPSIYQSQDYKSAKVNCVTVFQHDTEGEAKVKLMEMCYDWKGRTIDSTDAEGDEHHYTYDEKDRLARYDFKSTQFMYEQYFGTPEFRRSKVYLYNDEGQVASVQYLQMDSLATDVKKAYDKKGHLISETAIYETGDIAFHSTYTYDKKGNLLSFQEVDENGVPIMKIQYEYEKNELVGRVEEDLVEGSETHWTRESNAGGEIIRVDATFLMDGDAGEVEMYRNQEELRIAKQGETIQSKTWKQSVEPKTPKPEVAYAPLSQEWILTYDASGQPETLTQKSGETTVEGKFNYLGNGLIDSFWIKNEAGEWKKAMSYDYGYFPEGSTD